MINLTNYRYGFILFSNELFRTFYILVAAGTSRKKKNNNNNLFRETFVDRIGFTFDFGLIHNLVILRPGTRRVCIYLFFFSLFLQTFLRLKVVIYNTNAVGTLRKIRLQFEPDTLIYF